MDHIVDTFPGRSDKTLMPSGSDFITSTRRAAKAAGITLFDLDDPRQGIAAWRLYLKRFPNGEHTQQARRNIAKFARAR